MTQEEAAKAVKTFLESTPLLQPLRITLDEPVRATSDLVPGRLQLPCSHQACREVESTTWMIVPRIAGTRSSFQDKLVFKCAHCGVSQVEFWCLLRGEKTEQRLEGATLTNAGVGGSKREYVVQFEILKVGQWPPWAPVVSRRLEKNLGPNLEFFRRAVACIRQSLGIGACAYMRRIIEEETDQILDLVERAAKSEGDQKTLTNVAAARRGKAASDRLKQAAKRLPASLRPGGVNSLARLFGAFSDAVHNLPEEKALERAQEMLDTFIFLFENLREQIEHAEAFASKITAVGNPRGRTDG